MASLARTCRLFHLPAIMQIWSTQRGFVPLLRCMPDDLWEWGSGGRLVVRAKRQLVPRDWERFNYYAVHVRRLCFGQEHMPRVPPGQFADCFTYEAFISFVEQAPTFPPFCQLRELMWDIDFDYPQILVKLFKLFNIDSLKSLEISSFWENNLAAVIDLLGTSDSIMETLCIKMHDFDDFSPSIHPLISRSLAQVPFPHLKVIFAPFIVVDWDAITSLASLRSIQTIDLSLTRHGPHSDVPMVSKTGSPLNFGMLCLRAEGMSEVADFLGYLAHFGAEELVVFASRAENDDVQITLFHALAGRCSPTSIRTLSIQISQLSPLPAIIDYHAFHLLFQFRNLASVTLEYVARFDIDDSLLSAMADAWPHLRVFKVSYYSRFFPLGEPRTTLSGLIPLVNKCPQLSTLKLPMDTPTTLAEWIKFRKTITSKSLATTVEFDPITVSKAVTVAAIITDMFPNISDPRPYGMFTSDFSAGPWGKTRRYISAMVQIRKDSCARIGS
ncbi:hypothetical protein JAAARDRAFT_191205 [Jaapia argillacea MUCL 33604]|uniref:F-box domain-containing protein n=1 Tax=Jaapia argillacea MUCL 33604 TaxID=933084 RepID=A0A067Q1Y8_9AGAM|nr:hypothetical protein JAAARDRAFT_191205 [Jaapia argillacea MUCL 33604]